MHVVYAHCCGLDVHKKTITACLLISGAGGKGQSEIRRFGTMTRDLLELADWLQGHHVTQVAMESTGVYWKPVWNILEGQFEVVLVNAQHLKAVPGRTTDIKDCHRYLNNRAENSHQPTRQRERYMQRFKSPGHAQRFLTAYGPIAQHFRPRRHRFTAPAYRQELKNRFHIWQAITGTALAA